MKKIFCIIATVLLAASCYDSTVPMTECESHNEFVRIKSKNWAITLSVYRYEYDGHKYILFGDSEMNNGVVHDPDCPCQAVKAENKTETSDYPDWW